jgi:hypothetical protein
MYTIFGGSKQMKDRSQAGVMVAPQGKRNSDTRGSGTSLAEREKGDTLSWKMSSNVAEQKMLKMKDVPNMLLKTNGKKATECLMPIC